MLERTTVEIDQELLDRAKRALGTAAIRGTVEAALLRAIEAAELEAKLRAKAQRRYLETMGDHLDLDVRFVTVSATHTLFWNWIEREQRCTSSLASRLETKKWRERWNLCCRIRFQCCGRGDCRGARLGCAAPIDFGDKRRRIGDGQTKVAGILLPVAGIGGFIAVSLAYIVAGPPLSIGGILALLAKKRPTAGIVTA